MTDMERMALAEEAASLPIHVQMCAMRHQQILTRIETADAEAKAWRSRVEKGIWALLVMVGGGLSAGASQIIPIARALAGH